MGARYIFGGPTDEDFIKDFLLPKHHNTLPPENDFIKVVNLYGKEPAMLISEKDGLVETREGEWYAFTRMKNKKVHLGSSSSRRAGKGTWRTTEARKVIKDQRKNNEVIGYKSKMAYRQDVEEAGQVLSNDAQGTGVGKTTAKITAKTDWLMIEYRIDDSDLALCKIYKTPSSTRKKKNEESSSTSSEPLPNHSSPLRLTSMLLHEQPEKRLCIRQGESSVCAPAATSSPFFLPTLSTVSTVPASCPIPLSASTSPGMPRQPPTQMKQYSAPCIPAAIASSHCSRTVSVGHLTNLERNQLLPWNTVPTSKTPGDGKDRDLSIYGGFTTKNQINNVIAPATSVAPIPNRQLNQPQAPRNHMMRNVEKLPRSDNVYEKIIPFGQFIWEMGKQPSQSAATVSCGVIKCKQQPDDRISSVLHEEGPYLMDARCNNQKVLCNAGHLQIPTLRHIEVDSALIPTSDVKTDIGVAARQALQQQQHDMQGHDPEEDLCFTLEELLGGINEQENLTLSLEKQLPERRDNEKDHLVTDIGVTVKPQLQQQQHHLQGDDQEEGTCFTLKELLGGIDEEKNLVLPREKQLLEGNDNEKDDLVSEMVKELLEPDDGEQQPFCGRLQLPGQI